MPRGGSAGFSPAILRRHLQRTGYTLEEVADQIGLSRQAVSAWLAGRASPSPQSLAKVALLLDVTPADLTPGVRADALGLRDLRTRAGLSQSEVAHALELRQSLLSDIERGRRDVDAGIATDLAKQYGATIEDVVEAWEQTVAQRKNLLAARRKRHR
ncbi:helix-turn-helix transcriptional regulator [Gordonia rubripertincta]|uniref:helix-turn-helix domain-containing protein n=1 Tax=Gordonia rubripertincta TaxID=36822 RepID=UPI001180CEB5|nr:helix-turn-helix transcriptional regulator [Gordonia rubripertincta]TSD93469.1 helix-turn-helix transcriptional regulator [Gordonia rubripertincta]